MEKNNFRIAKHKKIDEYTLFRNALVQKPSELKSSQNTRLFENVNRPH